MHTYIHTYRASTAKISWTVTRPHMHAHMHKYIHLYMMHTYIQGTNGKDGVDGDKAAKIADENANEAKKLAEKAVDQSNMVRMHVCM